MKTKFLDDSIELLNKIKRKDGLNDYGKEQLSEFTAIKKALNRLVVVDSANFVKPSFNENINVINENGDESNKIVCPSPYDIASRRIIDVIKGICDNPPSIKMSQRIWEEARYEWADYLAGIMPTSFAPKQALNIKNAIDVLRRELGTSEYLSK